MHSFYQIHAKFRESFVILNAYYFLGRWGGIWSAPIAYKFDTTSSSQTDVKIVKKFDKWTPGRKTIQNRMPHIIENWLTTHTKRNEWGSITGYPFNY